MKIHLNLATSPLVSNRRFIIGSALLGTFAIGAMVWLSGHVYTTWRADRAIRAELAFLERENREYRRQRRDLEEFVNRPEILKARDRSAFLNGLIAQRSFPWTKIFMDLEHFLPEGVRVISIAPKMSAGRVEVRLVVGATTDESKLRFLRALEASKEFSRVQLLGETRPTRPSESDRVVLELVTWYSTT